MDSELDPSPRILVIGTSCAGKSTLARQLASRLACPHVELDELYWGPDWKPKPEARFRDLVEQAALGDSWVIEGNYRTVRDLLWPKADTVVWLNYSFPRIFWRGIRRTIARCVTRQELWHGNRESPMRSFASKESILVWILTTYRRRKDEFAHLRASNGYPQLRWVELTDPRQTAEWLRSLGSED